MSLKAQLDAFVIREIKMEQKRNIKVHITGFPCIAASVKLLLLPPELSVYTGADMSGAASIMNEILFISTIPPPHITISSWLHPEPSYC